MDSPVDGDWKKNVGFPINYSPGSSDDDFDCKDVVFRNPRQSAALLADCGDGTEADMLGTTPPRSRIRKKEMQRRKFDSPVSLRVARKDVTDHATPLESNVPASDRNSGVFKKRSSLKQIRNWERDSKLDMGHDIRCDSLPTPNQLPAVPTLVDTCSRFMSLTSRPKHREDAGQDRSSEPEVEERWRCDDEQLPPSRVNFHRTFSLLINMGNIDKGCKRAISREEQVWQNELKDLIWLELQAKLAGRSLAQQDAYLCAQRHIVPTLIDNLLQYKFVNTNPCKQMKQNCDTSSREDLSADQLGGNLETPTEEDLVLGCLALDCQQCADGVGQALRELGALLDAFYNAVALYPSSRAMTLDHPLIATPLFKNRLKAMCLWYNTALHMRLTMFAMLRMLRSIKHKSQRRAASHRTSSESDISRQSSESHRAHKVQFNISANPSDSSNSDSSAQSDVAKESDDAKESDAAEDAAKEAERKGRGDEVDSGCDTGSFKYNRLNTPEIVIDDKYGTSDTHVSSESEYMSASEPAAGRAHALDGAALAELTQMSLLNKCAVSLYRNYHREILKTQGVRRCMTFIYKMRNDLLDNVYLTLEKPDVRPTVLYLQSAHLETYDEEEPAEVFEDSKNEPDKQEFSHDEDEAKISELKRYGCWSEECLSMRLPSYRSHFLLLSSICMEAVHDYLSFRLEARPDNPSCLTVKQLLHELREGLDISSEMRAHFVRHARAALRGRRAPHLLPLLDTFDATVQTLLEQYLSYLGTMSETESMSRACLQAEWAFTARLAKRIHCASTLAPIAFSNITCTQLNRLLKQFDEELGKLQREEQRDKIDLNNIREAIYAVCRSMQSVWACSRDTTLQLAQWARALAARLARAPPPAYVQQRGDMFNCIMAIRDFIMKHIVLVLEKSKASPADELPRELIEALMVRVRELLLQMYKLGFELHKELYKFVYGNKVYEERSLRRRPVSLQPMRAPAVERRKRPETMLIHESFNPMLHKELHRFVNDAASRSTAARRSVTSPPGRRAKFLRNDSIVEDYETNVFEDRLFDNIPEGQTQSMDLLLGEQPLQEDVELRKPGAGRVTCAEQQWAGRVARAVIEFAKCWMQFVVERCDRGRGLRPRWACQGLDFLMLACDPCNTKHLSDEEFEELKQLMDGCISHVVGSRPAPRTPDAAPHSPRPRPRLPSPFPGGAGERSREALQPGTPPSEPETPLSYPEADSIAHRRRVLEAIERVDRERDSRLQSSKSVGKVLESAVTSYEPKLRQLTFKWQRGLKIGAGTFGKVYTVVNTESGQLLAMKELSIGAGDRRALQRAANELRVLEGVVHPHLVRYYGCELHREEMLIFMELCVEGSLEALVATSGALAEHTVRRYTKQLLSAVCELHARSIAHRDIKSGNIFLTNEGHCLKLGDFGCAVKIRANTTAPGELQGFVGTQAYMAPEVFMKTSGHGRAADIWSLGCVVTEMASGKRPFSEYDSNYQIMFVVGMGGRPAAPRALSAEGQAFCCQCLTHDPELRPRAHALAQHHFLLVKSDDDCKCEPAFLIT